tara:strand:+ start:581 stop:904 length:324 start_codon:yes stop_codon:yes gene_type:complete
MALLGYPKRFDHPKITKLEYHVSDAGVTTATGGNYMLIKTFGDDPTTYIHFKVKYPHSLDATAVHDIKVTAGTSLQGPFSHVEHHSDGNGPVVGSQNCWTLVYEVED